MYSVYADNRKSDIIFIFKTLKDNLQKMLLQEITKGVYNSDENNSIMAIYEYINKVM